MSDLSHATPDLKPNPFFAKPFYWLLLAVGLSFVPLVGYILQSSMTWDEAHPAINAMLNSTCLVFLIAGRAAIKGGNVGLHRRCMWAAFVTSSVFLVSYVTRYVLSRTHLYPGDGWPKVLYLVILFSHMVLAAALVPLVLRSIWLGLKDERAKHRRLVRWTWPIWVYVSVTGVAVYFMLYQLT